MKKLVFAVILSFGALTFSGCNDEMEEIVPQLNSDDLQLTEGTDGNDADSRD